MIFSIFGGGFGLYGYLPALIRCGHTVMLLERYRSIIEQRDELSSLIGSVAWRATEDEIHSEAEAVAISRRPLDQTAWLLQHADTTRASSFILEKPLGISPASAFGLLSLMVKTRKICRIAYTFRFMPWSKNLAVAVAMSNKPEHIDIAWKFRAHHYRYAKDNWKRRVSEGGGALRFFGIHVVGLLAEMGYRDLSGSNCFARSPDECETWSASFRGPNLRECRVFVDSNSDETVFKITDASDGRAICIQSSPLDGVPRNDGLDNRVEVLESLCRSLTDETVRIHPWYEPSIALWERAELASKS